MAKIIKESVINWIEDNKDVLIQTHQNAWQWAEVGLQEFKTSQYLVSILKEHGFQVQENIAEMPSAFVATYGSGRPVIGLMAELDALPGLSQDVVPYPKPINEGAAGHGCGHCSYAATALGAALAVRYIIEHHNLKGTVKCFGCPAEETLIGKIFMVRDGYFNGLDAVMGHHPGVINGMSLGSSNAMNSVKFEFFGKSSHAAGSPEQGVSALDAVELMNIGVNYMREHIVQEARIHYVVEEGGHEPNVVPAYARSWYYVRAPTRDLVNQYYERILRMADGADLMVGTTHKVQFLSGAHNSIQNKSLAELIVANMRSIGAPEYTDEEQHFAREIGKSITREEKKSRLERSSVPEALDLLDIDLNTRIYDPFGEEKKGGGGSTDVADVSWIAPTTEFNTTQFVVGVPGHSWQHTATSGSSIGHKSTIFAAKTMAATTIDLLTNPQFIVDIKSEWSKRMEGLSYVSPLPADLKPPLDQLKPM